MAALIERMRSGLPASAQACPADRSAPASPAPAVRTATAVSSPQQSQHQPHRPNQASHQSRSPAAPLPANLTLPQASPCQSCGCPGFWVDPYGGLHCMECRPAKSAAMVRRKLIVGDVFDRDASGAEKRSGYEWRDCETDEIIFSGSSSETESNPPEKLFFIGQRGTCPGGGAFAALCEKNNSQASESREDLWTGEKITSSPVVDPASAAGRRERERREIERGPIVPAGARIFYLLHDGKQVEAGGGGGGKSRGGGRSKKSSLPASSGGAGGKTDDKPPIDRSAAKWFTWEGAGRWWRVEAPAEGRGEHVNGEAAGVE